MIEEFGWRGDHLLIGGLGIFAAVVGYFALANTKPLDEKKELPSNITIAQKEKETSFFEDLADLRHN